MYQVPITFKQFPAAEMDPQKGRGGGGMTMADWMINPRRLMLWMGSVKAGGDMAELGMSATEHLGNKAVRRQSCSAMTVQG